MNKEFIIANGISIPAIGYGTWKIPSGDATFQAVTTALANGYRHLDCAAVYGNEASVGEAILASGIDRHELFITSKVWNTDRGYDKVMAAFTKTCQDLKTDYLDLYLIHWPANKHFSEDWDAINQDSWRALIDLYKSGRCKAIGVSNFLVKHLKSLMDSEIAPMVNQLEYHPGFCWSETVAYCQEHNILVEAWSPLASGRIKDNALLTAIGKKYQKSWAQVALRYLLEKGALPLPKSLNEENMRQNLALDDFELSANELAAIDELSNVGFSNNDPDEVTF